jgi:prevent-host-death family protein
MKATKTQLKNETGRLLRAAIKAPVIITDHGSESHVLLAMEDYLELIANKPKEGNKTLPAMVLETPEQED